MYNGHTCKGLDISGIYPVITEGGIKHAGCYKLDKG